MKSRRTASSSAVPKTLSRVMRRSPSLAGVLGHVGRVLPEGGHLDDLAVAEVDVGQPEAPADEPAVAEDGPHLARVGVGGEVEVLGRGVEQQVADAAAHEVGLVAHGAEPVDDAQRVLVEPVDRDLRLVVGIGISGSSARPRGAAEPRRPSS